MNRYLLIAYALTLASAMPYAHAQSPPGFWLTGYSPGAGTSRAQAVSADGSVVIANELGGLGGFRWTRGGGRDYFDPDPRNFYTAISADGFVTAGQVIDPNDPTVFYGFRRVDDGPVQIIPNPPTFERGIAFDVSANGSVVVGKSESGANTNSLGIPWRWSAETGTQLLGFLPGPFAYGEARGVSADGRTVVGFNIGSVDKAFQWKEGSGLTELPPLQDDFFLGGSAFDVSADGRVAVGYSYAGGRPRAVRWVDGGPAQDLGILPGFVDSNVISSSADGSVLFGRLSGQTTDLFVWTEETGMTLLRDYAESFGVHIPEGMIFTYATNISADGLTFVGSGRLTNSQAFVLTVPSPAFGLQLMFAGLALRRRRTAMLQRS